MTTQPESQTNRTESRTNNTATAGLISIVKTPLQLMALPVVVVEVVLLVLASRADGQDRTILIIGMLVILTAVVVGGYLLAHSARKVIEKSPDHSDEERTLRIEGDYYADNDPNYKVHIRHLSGNTYEVINPVWRGAGRVVGSHYYGIYVYGDNVRPERYRNTWGAHMATFDPASRSFEGELIELSPNPPVRSRHSWTPAQKR